MSEWLWLLLIGLLVFIKAGKRYVFKMLIYAACVELSICISWDSGLYQLCRL